MIDQDIFKFIVAPMEESIFLEKYFGKTFCHIEQSDKDFSSLFSWKDLDHVLQTHWIHQPRMRVVFNKTKIEEKEYLNYSPKGLKKYHINTHKIKEYLHKGAALVIDNIDQINTNLKTLANSLEWKLNNFVKINAYFAYSNSKGFPPHADYHDVLVLQVSGSKVWNIYGNNHHPIRDVYNYAQDPPTKKALWTQELKEGEVLYIPRGCWHDAYTEEDSHSIHLTIGIYNKTGYSFLNWFTQNYLSRQDAIRQDIPFALYQNKAKSEGENYIQNLKKIILDNISEEALRAYIEYDNYTAESIIHSDLSPPTRVANLQEDDEIFVLSKRAFSFKDISEDHFEIKSMKKKWTFNKALSPFFEYLNEHRVVSVKKLLAQFEDKEITFFLLEKCLEENLIGLRINTSVKIKA